MPDMLSLSSGVTLGVMAGIVSGVCYLVANGLVRTSNNDRVRVKRCLSASAEEVCCSCGGDLRGGLVPCICHSQPERRVKFERGGWFLRQVHRAISLMPWTISTERLELIEEECESRESPTHEQRELRNIREFLETIAAKMVGGTLEGTRVAPLYHHPACLPRAESPSIDSASSSQPSNATGAHAQLKRLVARVVEEAAALPALARYAAQPASPSQASTYEDLLATAILNKVIERYQTENGSGGRSSSGIHSASASPTPSERSSPRNRHRGITPTLREEDEISDWEEGETVEESMGFPRRVPFPEFGGDIVHNTDNEERDFDEVSCSDIQAIDGSWEENWLFQKKRIKTLQSVPVPMLVPNPNTEYKALIGDRDADDTTDLSDNGSDSEEQYKSNIKRVLDSKHVIGGAHKADDLDYEPDSLTIIDEQTSDDDEKVDECVKNRRDYIANNIDKNRRDYIANNIDKNRRDYIANNIDKNRRDYIANNIDKNRKDYIANNIDKKSKDSLENGKDSVLIVGLDSGPVSKAEFAIKEEIHRTLLNGTAEEYAGNFTGNTNGEVEKDSVDGFANHNDTTNTLGRHEKESEYEETVSVPVQRYADSLRRKHFDDELIQIPTRDTDKEDHLIPGTIAYRERKKWLNSVEMPNNPYSPEAIQRRLSAKSTSSLFDMITSSKDFDDDRSVKSEDILESRDRDHRKDITNIEEAEIDTSQLNLENITNGHRSKSPSPRILKDVLAEEVPQYKRYGRDYYVREAKKSAGGKKTFSDTSSVTSVSKTMSLDNLENEFASPGLLIKQFNTIASNQQYTKFSFNNENQSITTTPNNTSTVWIEYDDVKDQTEQTLFNAKPAYADDDTDKIFEEILQCAYNTEVIEKFEPFEPKSPSLDESFVSSISSSLDDSIKIYNVQKGEVVKSKESDSDKMLDTADKRNNNDNQNISLVSDESLVIIDSLKDPLDTITELEEILPQLPKVKELAKKFVSMDNLADIEPKPVQPPRRKKSKDNTLNNRSDKPKQIHMHSLTARSISRQFREELKLSLATPLTNPGGSKEVPEGEEVAKESSRPGSPLPEPGTTKTRLAFFESLRTKFSSNSK